MGLGFLYEEKENSVKVLRCYGDACPVKIPERIAGKPVMELGDYIFSDKIRETPKGLYWEEDGEENGTGKRPPAGAQWSMEHKTPLCGDRIREVTLPSTLRQIGRYAFYCCDNLKTLKLTCTIRDIGAGAFNSCRKITCLRADVVKGEKSCLKEILADLNETLTVEYRELKRREDNSIEETGRARLLFPVFYEEAVENTPARILETHVHGCGHRYRYCFQGTEFRFREYDALFPYAIACEAPSQTASIAAGRLRFPMELADEYRLAYEAYLMENLSAAAEYLTEGGDIKELSWFLSYFSDSSKTSQSDGKTGNGEHCNGKTGDGEHCNGKTGDGERGNGKTGNGEHGDSKIGGGTIKVEHASVSCLGNEGLTARAHEEYNDIRKPVLGETGYDKLIEAFSRLDRTDAVSLLMDARYRACPPKKRRLEW